MYAHTQSLRRKQSHKRAHANTTARARTCQHTHTHTHTNTHPLSLSLSHRGAHTRTHTHARSLSLAHSHTHTHTHACTHAVALSLCHIKSQIHLLQSAKRKKKPKLTSKQIKRYILLPNNDLSERSLSFSESKFVNQFHFVMNVFSSFEEKLEASSKITKTNKQTSYKKNPHTPRTTTKR